MADTGALGMKDVRAALWRFYEKVVEKGKRHYARDAWCEIHYPTIAMCKSENDFLEPHMLEIRVRVLPGFDQHCHICRNESEQRLNCYVWGDAGHIQKGSGGHQ